MLIYFLLFFNIFSFDVSNLRTAKYTNKTRLVIDFTGVKEVNYFKTINNTKLSITFTNINISKLKKAEILKKVSKIGVIRSLNIINLNNENELIFDFLLTKKFDFNIFPLTNPSRLVIDVFNTIKKSKKGSKK